MGLCPSTSERCRSWTQIARGIVKKSAVAKINARTPSINARASSLNAPPTVPPATNTAGIIRWRRRSAQPRPMSVARAELGGATAATCPGDGEKGRDGEEEGRRNG
jgi:hypothetical protein